MQPVDTNGHGDPEFAALSEHPHSMQQESLTATIKRYQPTLYRVAFRMLRNAQDAEDAVQDALLLAFRNLSQFKGEAKMTTTWLTAIVVNSARAVIQRHYSRRQTVSLHQMEDEEVRAGRIGSLTAGRVPKRSIGRAELRCKLRKASKRLSPGVRDAFQLVVLQGRPIHSGNGANAGSQHRLMNEDFGLILKMAKEKGRPDANRRRGVSGQPFGDGNGPGGRFLRGNEVHGKAERKETRHCEQRVKACAACSEDSSR